MVVFHSPSNLFENPSISTIILVKNEEERRSNSGGITMGQEEGEERINCSFPTLAHGMVLRATDRKADNYFFL